MTGNDFPYIKDFFYNNIFNNWAELHYKILETREDILKTKLWYNHDIKIGGKMIRYREWEDAGIRHVNDLFDLGGNIIKKQDLQQKYKINIKFLAYESLVHAIPKKWKDIIKNKGQNNELCVFRECILLINEQKMKLEEVETKAVYWEIIEKYTQRPTSEQKWAEKTGILFTIEMWADVYNLAKTLTKIAKIITFQFKITHRILACNYNLYKWQIKDTSQCDKCCEIDTLEHHI
jgi:hypothetical protein